MIVDAAIDFVAVIDAFDAVIDIVVVIIVITVIVVTVVVFNAFGIAIATYLSDQAPDEVLHEDEAERLPRPEAVRLLHDDTIRLVEMSPHQTKNKSNY